VIHPAWSRTGQGIGQGRAGQGIGQGIGGQCPCKCTYAHLVMRGGVSRVQGPLGRVDASGSSITICTLAVSPKMVDSKAVMKVTSSGHLKPLLASTTKPAFAVASLETFWACNP